MSGAEAVFHEASAADRVVSVPLSHLSIELGHLYMEDFEQGPDRLREMFRQVAPWVATAERVCAEAVKPKTPRISTCFLIDDYFTQFSSPRKVLPDLIEAAKSVGLRIDYIARESACAVADQVQLAQLVAGRLVADPPPGTDGRRPPVQETGWLCNGERTPYHNEAMVVDDVGWRPPSENGARNHSIFVDVELWSERDGSRLWSCPFLAAVWQLLRLGVLRDMGERVASPRVWTGEFPLEWHELPAITQLRSDDIAHFSAYRTFSVLGGRFLPIEQAVRTILSQVSVERAVTRQIMDRAMGERLTLPDQVIERIEYAFAGGTWR